MTLSSLRVLVHNVLSEPHSGPVVVLATEIQKCLSTHDAIVALLWSRHADVQFFRRLDRKRGARSPQARARRHAATQALVDRIGMKDAAALIHALNTREGNTYRYTIRACACKLLPYLRLEQADRAGLQALYDALMAPKGLSETDPERFLEYAAYSPEDVSKILLWRMLNLREAPSLG